MIWMYLFLGVTFTLGGWCLCCGLCLQCSDDTEDSTIQVDIAGVAADAVDNTCCDDLNGSYILEKSSGSSCVFSKTYANGPCTTSACSQCDTSGCTVGCDESPTTICDPSLSGAGCSTNGTVTYAGDCPTCEGTESAEISLEEGAAQPSICSCACSPSGLIWDTDVMIIDHPEAATWAVTGEEVYYCDCTEPDCTASVGSSGFTMTVTLVESSGDTQVVLTGTLLSRSLSGNSTITGNPVVCATDINGLVLTEGVELTTGACTGSPCLCGAPTDLTLTFIP